jgi:hypothetical protein
LICLGTVKKQFHISRLQALSAAKAAQFQNHELIFLQALRADRNVIISTLAAISKSFFWIFLDQTGSRGPGKNNLHQISSEGIHSSIFVMIFLNRSM